VYVLSGKGAARIAEQTVTVGPGDFLGFPCDGTVHHLTNVGDEDLIYLQGGERGADVGVFPTLGKVGIPVTSEGYMGLVDEAAIERIPFTAWQADAD
jgi:uncharacterized cupin superfamily protein